MDTKGALYETGIRIPQFAHYPAKIPTGTTLDAPASTVDVAATMIDYAGIESTYQRDGMSWKDVIRDQARKSFWKDERCLLFEVDYDCLWTSKTPTEIPGCEEARRAFDLCDSNDDYVTANDDIREDKTIVDNVVQSYLVTALE